MTQKKMAFFKVFADILEDVQLSSMAELDKAHKAESFCGRLTPTVVEPGSQSNSYGNGILIRRAIIDGFL